MNRSSVLSNEVASACLSSRLDVISIDLQQLSQFVRSRSSSTSGESSYGNNSRVMNNLEDCIRSAAQLVSSASTIVSSRTTVDGGSVFGQELSEEQRTRIDDWIVEPAIFRQDNSMDVPMTSELYRIAETGFRRSDSVEPSLPSVGREVVIEEMEQEKVKDADEVDILDWKDLSINDNPEKLKLNSEQSPDGSRASVTDSRSVSKEGQLYHD